MHIESLARRAYSPCAHFHIQISQEELMSLSGAAEQEFLKEFSSDLAPARQREQIMALRILERFVNMYMYDRQCEYE